MQWIVVLALVLPAPAAAQEKKRIGEFLAMSPQRIADALLPAGHVPIAGAVFDRMGGPRPPAPFVPAIHGLRFYTTSVPVSADFCAQDEIIAEITPMPDAEDAWLDAPPRLLRETKGRRLYRHRAPGTACDGSQKHFSIFGVPENEGLDAYRTLAAAAKLASRSSTRLPFSVKCVGMVVCRGPRDAMRNLPLDMITSVQWRENRADGRKLIFFEPPLSGMMSATIAVTFRRGRIERVEYSVNEVVF